MKLEYPKDKNEMLSVVLFGVSAFLGILILIKVTSFFVTTARAGNIVREAVSQNFIISGTAENAKPDDTNMEKHFTGSVAVAGELKKNNLFAPPPPKQHPVSEVLGIMGNEALIGGRWYKVGDRIADARIVAIEPAQVRIEWDGSEKVFAPIDARGSSEAAGPVRGGPGMGEAAGGGPGGRAPMTVSGSSGAGPTLGPGRGGFGGLSPEERTSMRARFENMSEEERQAFREQMSGRFGGGPGSGGGGGLGSGGGGGPGSGSGGGSGSGSGGGRRRPSD